MKETKEKKKGKITFQMVVVIATAAILGEIVLITMLKNITRNQIKIEADHILNSSVSQSK